MKVAILTLGCKVNYYESEKIAEDFASYGFEIVDFNRPADIYIINTCTVTNIADRKSRKMIHRARRMNPEGYVVATGCYVNGAKEKLAKDAFIDALFVNEEKKTLAKTVYETMLQKHRIQEGKELEKTPAKNHAHKRTRKFIKIQDGCNLFCTYCTIPFVRGRGKLISMEEEEVLKEVCRAAKEGFQEVVLNGIHLSSYGVDLQGVKQFTKLKGEPLAKLLQKVNEIPGIERIRLGSLEPRIIRSEFLEGVGNVDKLCPHFHLSLQSGCDETLKEMNRHYTTADFRKAVELLRQYYDTPAVTTDVIVGFPGETEERFAASLAFVREIGFAGVHVFPYSERAGTVAAKREDQVDGRIKQERVEAMGKVVEESERAYGKSFVGTSTHVLFEEFHKGQDLVGYTDRYVRVKLSKEEALDRGWTKGSYVEVELRDDMV